MKKVLKLAVVASLFTAGIVAVHADSKQDGSEAMTRLEGVKKVFASKGLTAIAFLNGLGASGEKGRDNSDNLEALVDNFNDPDAPLICIGKDDTYIVHTGQPKLVNESAVSGEHIWRDGVGVALVEKARQALSRGAEDGKTAIDFVNNSRIKNPRQGQAAADNDWLALADHRYIKGLPEGAFCATNAELFEVRDNSDANRGGGKDAGEGKIGHDVDPKKSHTKKHKAGEAKKADEHKAGEAKKADEHKAGEAKKADEHKAGEAKKADEHKAGEAKKADEHKADEAKKTDEHKAEKK